MHAMNESASALPRDPRSSLSRHRFFSWVSATAFLLVAALAAMIGLSTASASPTSGAAVGRVGVPLVSTATPTSTPTVAPTPTLIARQSVDSVTYQINPAHTGAIAMPMRLPLRKIWSRDLRNSISYPIIADGKVFVTVGESPLYGTVLYALDAWDGRSAWGPVPLPSVGDWSTLAYDDGRLFVLSDTGVVQAFEASNGRQLWATSIIPYQTGTSSPPVALQGVIYVVGDGLGGNVFALDERGGKLRWKSALLNYGGADSSPALSADGAFVTFACTQTYKFDRLTGQQDWVYNGSCYGDPGRTPVYANGLVYARDSGDMAPEYTPGDVLDSSTGAVRYSFQAGPIPAVSNQYVFALSQGTLSALDPSTGATIWTFTGDGALTSAPIIVNDAVFVASSQGNLYALDANATTAQVLWQGQVGAGVLAPDEQDHSRPLTGLGAGDGVLVVPAGTELVAYSSAFAGFSGDSSADRARSTP